eukprot:TRINITY_DN6140_c0_g1_i1.p1 TRINITY_DN6140_c0_g1~~TRINITY_DN6140_c0_g1_i1.p1  ORF type:complete len:371 (+),score=47.20 TRINITY_DN6140_c0_g1_i1:162-1115(+)
MDLLSTLGGTDLQSTGQLARVLASSALAGTDLQSTGQLARVLASSALAGSTGLMQISSKLVVRHAAKSLKQYVAQSMATYTENNTDTDPHSGPADDWTSENHWKSSTKLTLREMLEWAVGESVGKTLFTVIVAVVLSTQLGKGLARAGEGETLWPSGQFSSGLFECGSDLGTCMLSCCCPSAQWAHNVGMVPIGAFWAAFFLRLTFTVILDVSGDMLGLLFFFNLQGADEQTMRKIFQTLSDGCTTALVVLGMLARQRLRTKFGMETGGIIMLQDTCLHLCCACCAIAQEARHIRAAAAITGEPVSVQAPARQGNNA